jgi:predicted CoA-binding protein
MTTRSSKISRLLMVQSVATVGALSDPTNVTGHPIEYMQRLGFRGKIFPVNPLRPQVQALKSRPSLGAIGVPIELVIVATATDQIKGIAEGRSRSGCADRLHWCDGRHFGKLPGHVAATIVESRHRHMDRCTRLGSRTAAGGGHPGLRRHSAGCESARPQILAFVGQVLR